MESVKRFFLPLLAATPFLIAAFWGLEIPIVALIPDKLISKFETTEPKGDASDMTLAEAAPQQTNVVKLSCLTDAAIEKARNAGSVDTIYSGCYSELKGVFGNDFGPLTHSKLKVFLAAVTAANFAAYGPSSAINFQDIARDKTLNCGNLIFLAGYLSGGLNNPDLRPIGFDGGAVGNHAQILYRIRGEEFLLDPTVGLIAAIGFDPLLRGEPAPAHKIRTFSIRPTDLEGFREQVYTALIEGKYRPSDLMYMHETLEEMKQKGGSSHYFTPGGIYLRDALRSAPHGN